MVFFNMWGLHNDEKYISEPERFNPDRFAGRILLAAEYATSADYESRDHYNYGTSSPAFVRISILSVCHLESVLANQGLLS